MTFKDAYGQETAVLLSVSVGPIINAGYQISIIGISSKSGLVKCLMNCPEE